MIRIPTYVSCPGCGVCLLAVLLSPPASKFDWQFKCRNTDCDYMNYTKSRELKGRITSLQMAQINLDLRLLVEKARIQEPRPMKLPNSEKQLNPVSKVENWEFGGVNFRVERQR